MTREEANKLYEGKFFYEVVKPEDGVGIVYLYGPLTNVYYLTKRNKEENIDEGLIQSTGADENVEYAFVQVIDGTPVTLFTNDEILVTTKEL